MRPFHTLIGTSRFNGGSTIQGSAIDEEVLFPPGNYGTTLSEDYIREHENFLVRLSVNSGDRYYGDYNYTRPNVTVVTDRFLTVLQKLQPDGWDVVPVNVEIVNRPKLNPPPDRFYIFTVVGLVDGMDEEKTEYVKMGNKPPHWKLPVHRYALKPGACQGLHLFRLKQYPNELIVSEDFKRACVAQKLRGLDFRDLLQVDDS